MSEGAESLTCWVCPNCGQMYFGDDPPDMCAFCEDFTTWKQVAIPNATEKQKPPPPSSTFQPKLFDAD